jgi:hypothetical protein
MDKIKIGDTVDSKYGPAQVKSIEMISPDTSFADDDDNIPMTEIWACDKNRCVFDLSNGHWQYGHSITTVKNPIINE